MTISKNSALYKYTYLWYRPPENNQTNLCQFFWRFILAISVFPISAGILFALAIFFSIIFELIAVIFCGYYFPPTVPFINPEDYRRISWLPKIKGYHILPIYPIILSGCGFLCWQYPVALEVIGLIALMVLFILLGIAIIALFGRCFSFVKKSSAYQLTAAYIKAKKERVCPIITFIDGQTAAENPQIR
ncbi:hypothetical protein HZB94_02210 [Candidatus Falkowbacteria bacterium]|nr:hypothetical protein [Candidatus Falkowbacteria bacterium]